MSALDESALSLVPSPLIGSCDHDLLQTPPLSRSKAQDTTEIFQSWKGPKRVYCKLLVLLRLGLRTEKHSLVAVSHFKALETTA